MEDNANAVEPDAGGTNLEAVREKFKADRFASVCAGAVIDSVSGDSAVCSFEIGPNHLNAGGNVMGGAIFTLADFAFAVASNNRGGLVVSIENSIQFIGSSKGSKLIATAIPDKVGRSMVFYTVKVEDDLGKLIAKVSVVGKRVS